MTGDSNSVGHLAGDFDDISDLILNDLAPAYTTAIEPCTIDRIAAAFDEIQASSLPPLPERLSVHPADKDAFLGLFEKRDTSQQPAWMGQPLLGIPVLVDDQVPRNTVRVRVDGQDRDFSMFLPRWTPA